MLRGPISEESYRCQFSGHEKFPLRYGWITKLYEQYESIGPEKLSHLLKGLDAIAVLGVGKNMVSSMRHWGCASGIFEDDNKSSYGPTALGKRLLKAGGWDPYLEEPASLWLLHWRFAGWPGHAQGAHKTATWFWAFNHYGVQQIDRNRLISDLLNLCKERGWTRASEATLKGDVECFLRTYSYSRNHKGVFTEDSIECPLSELGLITQSAKGSYEFNRGPKPGLPSGVFNFALAEFWSSFTNASTLSVEAITYEPGSPGMVFKLDENQVSQRLSDIDRTSGGAFQWTETAGIRQVVKSKTIDDPADLLASAYAHRNSKSEAA